MVSKPPTVKYHSFDVFLKTSFRDQRTDFSRRLHIGIGSALPFDVRFHGGNGGHGLAGRIVDHLGINVLAGEMHCETWTRGGPGHTPSNSFMSDLNAINRFHFISKDSSVLFLLAESLLLDGLALFADNLFASVPDPLPFVRFRRVVGPDVGGDLADYLFVDSFH